MALSPIAAADWSRPWTAAPRGSIGDPLVAVGPGGGVHVGWVDGYEGRLRVRRMDSRGRMGRIATLARKTSGLADAPAIAGAPSRALVAVWYVNTPDAGWSLRMRRMTRGALGPVRVVADSASLSQDFDSTRVQLVAYSDGSATVVWGEVRGLSGVPKGFDITGATVHARRMGVDGRLGPMFDVAEAGEIDPAPHVARGPGGGATVVWQARTSAGTVIRAATVGGNGTGAVGDISEASPYWSSDGPGIFSDERGIGLSIWPGSGMHDLVGRRLAGGAAQGPPLPIAPAANSRGITGVVDGGGKATVAWRDVGSSDGGFTNQAFFRQVLADGTLGPLGVLSAPHAEVSIPILTIDRWGVVNTGWTTMQATADRYRYAVQVRRIAADGQPGSVHTLDRFRAIPSTPTVVSNRRGHAMAIWSTFDRKGTALHAARYVAGCSKAQLRRGKRTSGKPKRCR
jgi:hypothetical protein